MPAAVVPRPAPRAAPWYRQRWPWLLMLGPGIVVVAGFVTLWLAVASDDGLVVDDYYKRGLEINRTLARTDRAAALGMAATVDVDATGNARVNLTARAKETASSPTTLRLFVTHPTRAGFDHRGELVIGPDGTYVGKIDPVAPGRWLVTVETDEWRLPPVEVNAPISAVRLRAGAR